MSTYRINTTLPDGTPFTYQATRQQVMELLAHQLQKAGTHPAYAPEYASIAADLVMLGLTPAIGPDTLILWEGKRAPMEAL